MTASFFVFCMMKFPSDETKIIVEKDGRLVTLRSESTVVLNNLPRHFQKRDGFADEFLFLKAKLPLIPCPTEDSVIHAFFSN